MTTEDSTSTRGFTRPAHPTRQPPAWRPIAQIKNGGMYGYHYLVNEVIWAQLENDHISIPDYVATIAAVVFTECGLIPISDESPVKPVAELLAMTNAKRYEWQLNTLLEIVRTQGHLKRVNYKTLVWKERDESPEHDQPSGVTTNQPIPGPSRNTGSIASPAAGTSQNATVVTSITTRPAGNVTQRERRSTNYTYGPDVEVIVIYHGELIMIASSDGYQRSVPLPEDDYMRRPRNVYNNFRFTPRGFITFAKFDPMEFSHKLKVGIIFEIMDYIYAVCTDIRAFNDLPVEILMMIANELDLKSFGSFLRVSKYINQSLDNNDGWKQVLANIPQDFRRYSFPVPPASERTLTGSAKPGEYKTLCKKLFIEGRRANYFNRIGFPSAFRQVRFISAE